MEITLDHVSSVQLSNGPDKKGRTKPNEQVRMQKGANFTVVSTTLLISV